jgi:sRNA-binding protein
MLPLAIGIAREIRAEAKNAGLNLSAVNRALTRHCTARTYQWNLAQENSQRHDLTGTAVEAVTDEHRTVARKSVAQKRNNKRKANSAAGAASKDEKRPKVQLE